ncbi:hypothetical protein [[Limnothrix rosea] IAM M-220]|uniref:hypothetical protein n=1 Tax=[Limnothrix rosea] IAM M-220 TaxID=454133 RepID=UPI000966341F|nr:hypothetical protein [[Limnothrix rosea] IAM M-220]OKH12340.1 hypothetical protein NIES208_16175 [[Limnothrix rosea] IAM M-220]
MFSRIKYKNLNPRQQESYNFQKIAAQLADYGFNCLWLTDDWQGADFIACHIDGNTFLKVQLKGRLTFSKKYRSKDIYIAFNQNAQWFVYPHDQLCDDLISLGLMTGSKSWDDRGEYSWPKIPKHLAGRMEQYAI